MVIGVSAGGDYDLRARLLARYLPKYIPGNPKIVPQNMLGAGGLDRRELARQCRTAATAP